MMRVIIVKATPLGLDLARVLIRRGDEVILIEDEPKLAQELSETLDCTVIQAEGTHPDILEKAEITKADAIVACSHHDQDNIIIGLIARNYGVPDVIVITENLQFMNVAKKLGFHHVVNPPQAASTNIYNALRGIDTIELSTMMRGDVRFVTLVAGPNLEGEHLSALALPPKTMIIGLYRDDDFHLFSDDPSLETDDEVIAVTTIKSVPELDNLFKEPE